MSRKHLDFSIKNLVARQYLRVDALLFGREQNIPDCILVRLCVDTADKINNGEVVTEELPDVLDISLVVEVDNAHNAVFRATDVA